MHKRLLLKKINDVAYYVIIALSFTLTLTFSYLHKIPASQSELIILKIPAVIILAFISINAPMFVNSYGEDYWKQGAEVRKSKVKRLVLEILLGCVIAVCGCFLCEPDVLWEKLLVIVISMLFLTYRLIRYAMWFVKNK